MTSFSDDSRARWWVKHNATNIVVSFNVASVTDTGVGDWTVNMAVGFGSQ